MENLHTIVNPIIHINNRIRCPPSTKYLSSVANDNKDGGNTPYIHQ